MHALRKCWIESTGKKWNVDTVFFRFYFQEGKSKGDIKGNATINVENLDYRSEEYPCISSTYVD